jgi:hypothetical protein
MMEEWTMAEAKQSLGSFANLSRVTVEEWTMVEAKQSLGSFASLSRIMMDKWAIVETRQRPMKVVSSITGHVGGVNNGRSKTETLGGSVICRNPCWRSEQW